MSGVFDWFRKPEKRPAQFQVPAGIPVDVDIYGIFGVSPTASLEEIRRAYREQARKFHPDLNPDDPVAARMFKQLTDYYGILEDTEKRAAYDRARAAFQQQAPPTAAQEGTPRPPTSRTMIPVQPPAGTPFEEAAPYGYRPQQPIRQAPAARAPAAYWETMFGPATEQGPPPEAFFGHFAPSPTVAMPPRPLQQPPPQSYAAPPRPPVGPPAVPQGFVTPGQLPIAIPSEAELPNAQEVAQLIYYTWPLDEIWNIVRADRNSASFRQSGLMQVDQVAGFGPESVEFEVGQALGIPTWFVQQFMSHGRAGFEALWNWIFSPMFRRVTEAMDILKPSDIRGRFGLDTDQMGRRVDLVYSERP
jgi:hypothetical protein